MQKTDKYAGSIIEILSRARKVNTEIGPYKEHFYNDQLKIVVRLSNGRIKLKEEYAISQERMTESLSDEIINEIAGTFRKNNPGKGIL